MVKYIGKIVLGEDMYHIKDIEARTNLIDKSEKGAASGVATLDASGKVPSTQLPSYTLPTASSSVLGGIKVGTNLSIDNNGVLSADAGTEVEIGSGSPVDSDVKLFVDESAPVIEIVTGGFKLTTSETTGIDSFSAIGAATISNNATTGIDVFTFSAD